MQADEVSTFEACEYFGCLAKFLGVGGETCFGEDIDGLLLGVGVLSFDSNVVNLRTYAEGSVRRQCPRSGCPREEEDRQLGFDERTIVYQSELGCASRIFYVPIAAGLVEFVGTETCTRHRGVRLNGVALVKETFLVELFEQIPKGFDILVVVGDVRVLQINPVAHLLGEVRPLAGVFHHLLAASSVVLIDADLLADVLFGNAEFLLDAELNGQSVGIPAGFALHLIALHRFVAAESIFDRACQNVVNTRHSVC